MNLDDLKARLNSAAVDAAEMAIVYRRGNANIDADFMRYLSEIIGEASDALVVHAPPVEKPNQAATAITDLEALVGELREALVVAVAEMSRARGRLETIAMCNEDHRIAAALGRACYLARAALTTPEAIENGGRDACSSGADWQPLPPPQ